MKKQIKSAISLIATIGILLTNSAAITKADSDVANQMSNNSGQAISLYELVEVQNQKIEELLQENKILKDNNEEMRRQLILQSVSEENWEALCRVVTAEAGYQSAPAQKNVVWVVLNRVDSTDFPDTIVDVIMQKGQFACVPNRLYYNVEITDFTLQNVQDAYIEYYDGEVAEGALYFSLGGFKGLTYLFTDEVGHQFFK